MSNVLDYRFYLDFKNEGSFGLIEITEPIGFDGSTFTIEQGEARYGRDAFKMNEEINLSFYKGSFDTTSTPQSLPNGTIINNLTQGFEYLIDCYNRYGYESEIEFIVELDNVSFTAGVLDFQTAETDGYSYLSCKIIQTTGKQTINRRADIVTDIFSTEDLDGNEVTPAQTSNILLKAKPVRQKSRWLSDNQEKIVIQSQGGGNFFNFLRNLDLFGVQTSLTFFDSNDVQANFFKVIRSETNLSDLKVDFKNVSFNIIRGELTNPNPLLRLGYYVGDTLDNITALSDSTWVFEWENANDLTVTDFNLSFNIPQVLNGENLWIYFQYNITPSVYRFTSFGGTLEITATSTAIDSVIKGVRYIDVIKANVARLNGFTVDAERYDVNGKHYNQYAFTGNLIKQRDDVPFPVRFNELMEDLKELNADYQITDDKVYIGKYDDFYTNKEIGAFLTAPDDSFKTQFNERYAINQFEFKYKEFEQDRDEANTIDAIHTESQWLLSNKQVENTKAVEVGYIRDPYKIEATRKLGLKETTSTKDDDQMFLIDVVPLSPTAKGGFTSVLQHNVDSDDNLQLLRTELFRWDLLGFGVGSAFEIVSGKNVGNYTVIELDESLIRLQGVDVTPTFSGETFTEVSYPFTNVLLTNRTDEGLIFFDNLINGDDFSNLRYSIKRNIKHWHPYLATASRFNPDGTFKNTYFRNNGQCITRFDGEPANIQENSNILNVDLGNPILTPYNYNTRLLVPFTSMVDVMNKINLINEDKTIAGFIRCIDTNDKVVRLYPSKLEYNPSTETMTLTGEQRFDGVGVDITINSNEIVINEVGYNTQDLAQVWYEITDDYLVIYDVNNMPVINPTRFDNVTVDGNTFASAIDLMNYLVNN
jgi:hypothetical protein